MKIDKHNDSIQELYDYLMDELHGITTSLNGKLTTYTISNSNGNKQIQVCKQKPYKVLKKSNEDEWELCYDETRDLFCEN